MGLSLVHTSEGSRSGDGDIRILSFKCESEKRRRQHKPKLDKNKNKKNGPFLFLPSPLLLPSCFRHASITLPLLAIFRFDYEFDFLDCELVALTFYEIFSNSRSKQENGHEI